MINLQGVLPALVTPLDAQGRLDEAVLAGLLTRLYAEGCHGVYVAGNTGEGLLLSVDLREQLAAAVRAHTPPDRSVVVHVGCLNTADSLRLARHAASLGVTAISSLPPAGPYGFPELKHFYAELAAASSVPLLVYFFPEVAPAIRTYAQLSELCALPNVAGLKFTDFDFYTLARIKSIRKTVFNGRDEAFACGMLMGADGGIGSFYNVAPRLFVDLYDAARAGDWPKARAVQDRINQLISIVLAYPLFPALKRILAWQGVPCGDCVAPRLPLTKDQEFHLRHQLEEAGFLNT
jgi:N-acetylneuraminate lyase